MNYENEMKEIIEQVKTAKNRLAELTEELDQSGRDIGLLDEALVALDDAIDIMTDKLEEDSML